MFKGCDQFLVPPLIKSTNNLLPWKNLSNQGNLISIKSCCAVCEVIKYNSKTVSVGGAVASWLVHSSPDRAVRVRALAGDTVLCSWARHFTLTVPLSTQEYEWVPVICWGNLTKLLESDLRWTSIPSRGSRNTPSHFMLRKLG